MSGYDKWGPMRSSGRDSRDLDARDRQDIYYAHDMSTCTQPVAVFLDINNKYHTAESENPLVSFHFNSTIMMYNNILHDVLDYIVIVTRIPP